MESGKPYKLGIALSGGGARGFAHAGALKAIEEAGLKIDVIAGVSAGSVIAVLYANGVKPQDMLELFNNTGFANLVDFRLKGGGLFRMHKFINRVMKAIAPVKNLEELPIPTFIGTTDLDNACTVTFSEGPVDDIVMASCSIPIIFQPVKIGQHYYVDGGVLQNLPARTIRDKCDRLIGINVSPMIPFNRKSSLIDVAVRTYNLMAKANQRLDMDICDVVVETREISAYQVFNLKEINKVFNSGYINMRHALREAGWWNESSNNNTDTKQ